jgi:drug/metabolite transporter (DMT)-like permease
MSSGPAAGRRGLAVLGIVVANVLGGVSYPAQKAALAGLPPATVTWLRNAVALLALLACGFLRARRASVPAWTRAERLRVLALGSLAFALPMWLGIVGVERASASNASILILLEPVTIVAIAWLVLGERIGVLKLASLVLGLLGALAIVLEGASLGDLLAGEHFAGNALLALHGVLWGCYTPLAKPLSERHDPLDLCLRATLVSLVVLLPVVWAEAPRWGAGPELAPALAWTVALGLFVSFGATVLWIWALRHIPATNVAGFVFLQPLAGVLVGVGWMEERLSAAVLAGSALIVAGVGLDVVLSATRRGQAVAELPTRPG